MSRVFARLTHARISYDELAIERDRVPRAVVDKELRHEVRDELRALNGVPDYLNRDEKKVLRHFGLSATASEAAHVPRAAVDEFLAREISREKRGVLGDYLARDDKTVLQHFGYDVGAIEDAHVPASVVERELVRETRRENDYLNGAEKGALRHFGISPLQVELEVSGSGLDALFCRVLTASAQRVPKPFVDVALVAGLRREARRKPYLDSDETTVLK